MSGSSRAVDHGRAVLWLPLVAGTVALLKGQDANWDLRNYHLYNPWAWLNQRIETDLAPAGLQSYFNPLIDLPYYLKILYLPAPLVGLLTGVIHGLALLLVYRIAALVLPAEPGRERVAFWLTVAAFFGAAWLAGLGTSMGDHLTAVAVLAALYLVLDRTATHRESAPGLMLVPGLIMGLAVGLKLTNGIFALALALTLLLTGNQRWSGRFAAALVYAGGVVISTLALAGPWMWRLWREIGNPLFPQFNAVFKSPLAPSGVVADQRWGADGWIDFLVWPLIMVIDPDRVSDRALPQLFSGVIALLVLAWAARGLLGRALPAPAGEPALAVRRLLVFAGLAYLVWLALFGIYRYLIPLELLAPLLVWLLATRVWSRRAGTRSQRWLIIGSIIYALVFLGSWGNQPWAWRAVTVAAPEFDSPQTTTVLLPGNEPMAWTIPWLPPELAFIGVARMPETGAWQARADAMIERRDGPVFALLAAEARHGTGRVNQINAWLQRRGASEHATTCRVLRAISDRWLDTIHFDPDSSDDSTVLCRFAYRPEPSRTPPLLNARRQQQASEVLANRGWRLDPDTCIIHAAAIGRARAPYQLCRLTRSDP